jgi:hypothetical protein
MTAQQKSVRRQTWFYSKLAKQCIAQGFEEMAYDYAKLAAQYAFWAEPGLRES